MVKMFGLLLLGIMVIAAACGGGDDDDNNADDGGSDSSPATTAAAGDTSDGDSDSDDDGDNSADVPPVTTGANSAAAAAGANFLDSDCRFIVDGGISAGNFLTPNATGSFQNVADTWQEIADRAPGDIKDEMQTIAAALNDLAEGFEGVDLSNPASFTDPAVQQQLEQAGEAIDTDEFNAAQDAVEAWFDENCSDN